MEWEKLLLGEEDWSFLGEAAFRTCIMFLVILTSLRLLGKRGIKQLSVFELGVIIGLGSAAGDPMFYKDVGLLPGILVFSIVVGLYRLITFLISRSQRFEHLVEGKATYIIRDGVFILKNLEREPIATDELFTELRQQSILHLGQIELAILENNGEISVYFYPDNEIKYGLPILPELPEFKSGQIDRGGHYACTHCGSVQELMAAHQQGCTQCGKDKWRAASNRKRNR